MLKLPWGCTFGNTEQSYPALAQVYPMPNTKLTNKYENIK